ncbi:MAG TPA: HD domain-containing phosphohydrolase [Gemmatimonadales bacterium]|nr:HD domain-containing phosphohydrolase [Gemmatimonadales bacterium]
MFAPRRPAPKRDAAVRLSEVVAALSYALDITEGQPEGHAVRSCLIGMRVASVIGLDDAARSDLFYALLLKDLGCSSNAARLCNLFGADDRALKKAHKLHDWTDGASAASYAFQHVPGGTAIERAWRVLTVAVKGRGSAREMTETRCERGAEIARMLGLSEATATAIHALDEHWDGGGLPRGLVGEEIPLLARIAGLAQTVEVFWSEFGRRAAFHMARDRAGTWFDPALVEALGAFEHDEEYWRGLGRTESRARVSALEPADRVVLADDARLDRVAEAFARVVDAKSPYTARHSDGVARIALLLAAEEGLSAAERTLLRRAALLHDIGKLGVSNMILDKPAALTHEEMAVMREHPRHTESIVGRVGAFHDVARVAARHHERLDGRGYHTGLNGLQLGRLDRTLAVADVCEALLAARPYRAGLPPDQVRAIVRRQAGTALCAEVVEALERVPLG